MAEEQLAPKQPENENEVSAEEKGHGKGFLFGEIIESIAVAVILAVIIRTFLFQPFFIPSGSMKPALVEGDRIIVNKIIYKFQQPERGDILVFKYPVNPKRDFIKRIVGLPGETVEVKDSTVFIDGRPMQEPYLPADLKYSNFGPVNVSEGEYFMMGDNRNNSEDSRVWGALPQKNIVGKAFFVYWPPERVKILH